MAATKYTYSIQNDFPYHKVATDRLTQEIATSGAIMTGIDYAAGGISTDGDDCDIWFVSALDQTEETTLEGIVAAHSGEPLEPTTQTVQVDGTVDVHGTVVPELPEGRRCDHYTPNFCDKTTWHQDSARQTNVTLTDSGDHTTYTQPTPCYVVDVTHGKIYNEDELVSGYGVVVKVDGVTKTENPAGTTSGDFSVNYATGAVTFNAALAGTEAVTMTFSKVQSSLYKVQAPEGYKLRVGYVEVQFSENIGLTDTLKFQMWGLADVFAPGQYPQGTMIPISGTETYKTMANFICDAEKAYPPIPVLGSGDAWRMHQHPIYIFRFEYTNRAVTDIISTYGMEVRVWLENDIPYNGDLAIGTFYGIKEALT